MGPSVAIWIASGRARSMRRAISRGEGSAQRSPALLAGTSVAVRLFVDDVDECFARALAAGAVQLRGVADQFYGDRNGALRDPFGHVWIVSTHIEDLTPEQIAARMRGLQAGV